MRRLFRELMWEFLPWHKADSAIIRLLQAEGEMAGGAISAWLCIPPATLYPALYRLEMSETLLSRWDVGPPPRRRLYRLAPSAETTDEARRRIVDG